MKNKFFLAGIFIIFALIIFFTVLNFTINSREMKIMKETGISFQNIDMNIKLRNVEFVLTDDNTYGYEFTEKSYSNISHEVSQGKLYINEKINYFMFFSYISDIFMGNYHDKIVIYVPKNALFDEIYLKNTSGNVNINDIDAKTIELLTTSGNVNISQCSIDNLYTKHISGNFSIEKSIIENKFDLNSTSGDLTVTASSIENLKIKKTSGNIIIEGTVLGKSDIKKTSGNLKFINTKINGLSLTSTSGNTDISGIITGKTDIKSTSGNITFDLAEKRELLGINAQLSSGAFYINGEKQEKGKGRLMLESPNATNELNIKITSGNINLNFD